MRKVYYIIARQIYELYRKCCFIDEQDFYNKMRVKVNPNPIRFQLKHVGFFLGQLTLARNVPIPRIHLDLKYILYQSYTEDTLKLSVPFVCRVIKEAKDSVFKRPNPWMESLLSFLKEVKQGLMTN